MIISNMGGALEHWLGFQDKIGRSFMMNEDALKYPLSDYLVNEGGINLSTLDLEHPHPNFSNRLMDAAIYDVNNLTQLENTFELKLAKSSTRNQSERQRIFDDLMRLHLADSSTNDKCYFIITGKTTHFLRDFRDYQLNGTDYYKKWLSFTQGQSISFNVSTETNTDYLNRYREFITKYSKKYNSPTINTLQLPNQITTTCEFITAFKPQYVPYMAGIWSVK
jgi:hypothetical protein